MTHPPIYMDNHATTRVDPRVVEAMLPYLHRAVRQRRQHEPRRSAGRPKTRSTPRRDVDRRRASAPATARSSSPAARPRATTWRFAALPSAQRRRGNHLVSVATEHKAVLDPLARLGPARLRSDARCPVEQAGSVAGRAGSIRSSVADAIRDDTLLVSVMLANNEIGVIQPLAEIGAHLPASAACRCTATPRRRSARCRSTSTRWAST